MLESVKVESPTPSGREQLRASSSKKRFSLSLKKQKDDTHRRVTSEQRKGFALHQGELFQHFKGGRNEQSTVKQSTDVLKSENKYPAVPTERLNQPVSDSTIVLSSEDMSVDDSADDLPTIVQSYSISDETFAQYFDFWSKHDRVGKADGKELIETQREKEHQKRLMHSENTTRSSEIFKAKRYVSESADCSGANKGSKSGTSKELFPPRISEHERAHQEIPIYSKNLETPSKSLKAKRSLNKSASRFGVSKSAKSGTPKERLLSRTLAHGDTHQETSTYPENLTTPSKILKYKHSLNESASCSGYSKVAKSGISKEPLFPRTSSKEKSKQSKPVDVTIVDDSSDFRLSPITPSRSARKNKRKSQLNDDVESGKQKKRRRILESDESDTDDDFTLQSESTRKGRENIVVCDSSEAEHDMGSKSSDLDLKIRSSNWQRQKQVAEDVEALSLSSDDLATVQAQNPVIMDSEMPVPSSALATSSPRVDESFPFLILNGKTASSSTEKLPTSKNIDKNVQLPVEEAAGAPTLFDDSSCHSSPVGNAVASLDKQPRDQLFPDDCLNAVSKAFEENLIGGEVDHDSSQDWLNNQGEDIFWSQEYNGSVWQSIEEDLRANQNCESRPLSPQQKELWNMIETAVDKKKQGARGEADDIISPCEEVKDSPMYEALVTECDVQGTSGTRLAAAVPTATRSVLGLFVFAFSFCVITLFNDFQN